MSLFTPIKQKSLRWLQHSSKKLVKQIEKLKIHYHGGYKKIQPRILGKGVLSMVPRSIVESEEDNCKENFIPCLGSLKRRQFDATNNTLARKERNFDKLGEPGKVLLNHQISPYDRPEVDTPVDRVTPYKKLARLRRQSTAP